MPVRILEAVRTGLGVVLLMAAAMPVCMPAPERITTMCKGEIYEVNLPETRS